jgi:uncharacterized hydrophobic protein (TIGR00341 family)
VRLVQVTIPSGASGAVLGALDDEGIDYVVTEEASGREFEAVATFPLPPNAVEPVLKRLREAGLDEDAYTVVLDAETVVSSRVDELQERYAEDEDPDRIAREELRARAAELAPSVGTYTLMTAVSAAIAAAGLLLDSPAVVVGSMVIAPLVGPALTAAVGTVIDDRGMFVRGARLQAIGFGVAVATAAAFAYLVKTAHLVPPGLDVVAIDEVRERVVPDFLSLAVALGAGIAGAVSLRSGVSASLVGVMIAVALVPPAATVGIGIAWGLPAVALGAGVLGLVNALSINLAALTTFWYSGYRPERWFREDAARVRTLERAATLVAVIAVLSLFLGGVTLVSYQAATFEQEARAATDGVIDASDADLTLLDLEVTHAGPIPLPTRPAELTVTVGRPPGATAPNLAPTIGRRVAPLRTGPVRVEVRYVETERYPAGTSRGTDAAERIRPAARHVTA